MTGSSQTAGPQAATSGSAQPTRDAETGELRISVLVLGRDGHFAAQYDKQYVTPNERAFGFGAGIRGCTITLRDSLAPDPYEDAEQITEPFPVIDLHAA